MEDKIIKNFNKNRILEIQQNRDPFLMIDYAEEIVIEKSVKGSEDLEHVQECGFIAMYNDYC